MGEVRWGVKGGGDGMWKEREVECGKRGRWDVEGRRGRMWKEGGGGVWKEGEVECGRRGEVGCGRSTSSFKKHMATAVLDCRKTSVGNRWANLLGLSAATGGPIFWGLVRQRVGQSFGA